jgi:hypothetical protein
MNPTPSAIPGFDPGVHYRRGGSGRWKWVLAKGIHLPFFLPLTRRREMFRGIDGNGKTWLTIDPHSIHIPAGYAWNGASFSPDLRGVMLSSCVHDALYQFSGCGDWPRYLSREWADNLFYELSTSRMRLLYAIGLALGSAAFWGRPPGDGSRVAKSILRPR